MRLKGGKVLLDISDWDFNSKLTKSFDKEIGKALLQKGISLLITEPVSKVKVCVDLIPTTIEDGRILYQRLTNDDGLTFNVSIGYAPDYLSILTISAQ